LSEVERCSPRVVLAICLVSDKRLTLE
jgi:hypothetical protein